MVATRRYPFNLGLLSTVRTPEAQTHDLCIVRNTYLEEIPDGVLNEPRNRL